MERRYFIIDIPNPNAVKAFSVRLGEVVESFYNADMTKVFVKTTVDLIANSKQPFDTLFPPPFTTEYTLNEVREIVHSWGDNIIE